MIEIRQMRESDIPEITRIVRRVLSELDAEKTKKDMLDQSNKLYASGENFVAEINTKVVGIIGYWSLKSKHSTYLLDGGIIGGMLDVRTAVIIQVAS